ncbi:MAG: hypothetical protein GQE15_17330 [Archangiaceae bacterium]|nr:hypothetical protein [Archangiaceae bacterium]
MRVAAAVVLVMSSACIELSLPQPPPPPGPGTVQGTAVYAVPGRAGYRPAGGARVTLLSTGAGTVAAADSGRFTLSNVRTSTGLLLFTVDLDGDGTADRQRALDLATIGAGPGKNVALGDVVLSQNATVTGRVLRADNPLPTGHGGIAVFVPGAPYATATADTGDFVLENLPEGTVRLAFFLQGYGAESRDVAARGGEESRVSTTSLKRSTEAVTPATVSGVIRLDDGTPVANARVRFVSPTSTFVVTTDATGAFSTTTMNATLYQVAIEADGATSLRLYNVLLLPGMNDLGALQLTRGESMPLSVDAGELTPFDGGLAADGGPAGTSAVIDPSVLELAPGAMGQLSSGRSTGPRPLTAHWRNAGDGGLGVTFSAPDTSASFVQVFAPDASGLFPIALRVTDVVGVDSVEARGVVRVGARPSVTVSVDGGVSVAPGATVSLDAIGTTSDGQSIASFRWTQRTGPAITIGANDGPRLSFMAPLVVGPTPMTIDVVAITTLGFESTPASVTLVLQPAGVPTLVANPSAPIVLFDGGSTVVTFTASVMGGPPDAGWVFSWSPLRGGCPLPDGGLDSTCPEGWALSNVTGGTAQFQAPFVSGDKTFPFTVTATPAAGTPVLSTQVSVDVLDRLPPTCRSSPLSPLSVQVQCNEPMLVNALTGLDAGSAASSRVVADGGLLTFFFASVLPPTPLQFGISGLVDRSGNAPAAFTLGGTPRLTLSPTYVSSGATSTTNTRAAWMRLATDGGTSPFAIVARATGSVDRKIWVFNPPSICGGPSCPLVPSVFQEIPFYGALTSSTASVAFAGRAYVITSRGNPSSLVEYANGQWQEVPVTSTPDLFSLGTDGKQLFVFSVDGGSLERRLFDGGTFGPAELVTPIPNGVQSVEMAATPGRRSFVFTTTAGTGSVFEQLSPPLWNVPTNTLSLDTQNVDLKAVMFGEDLHDAFVFRRISDGFVEAKAWNPFTMQTMTSAGVPTDEYDVAPFGAGALLAWSSAGSIHLALVTRGPAAITMSDVVLEDGGLSFGNGGQGSFPRLTVEGTEVRLAWQEEAFAGAGYQVFGLVIR